MRVGLYTARPLGEAVAQIVAASGVEVVARDHEAFGWWGEAGREQRDDVFAAEPDLVISCLTHHLFTQPEIDAVPRGIVNLHPAPLPAYRGCNSYSHAILNGDRAYGSTLHYVDAGIDTGPIIAQTTVPIHEGDTARLVHDRAQVASVSMFAAWWARILAWEQRPGDAISAASPWDSYQQMHSQARYYRRDSLEAFRDLADHHPSTHDRIRRALTFPPHPMPKEPAAC